MTKQKIPDWYSKRYWWDIAFEKYRQYPLDEMRSTLAAMAGSIGGHVHYGSINHWRTKLLQTTFFDIADALTDSSWHGRIDSTPIEEEEHTQ